MTAAGPEIASMVSLGVPTPQDAQSVRSVCVRSAYVCTYSSTFISSGIGAIPCSIFSYVAILAQTFIAPGSLPFVGTRLVGSGSLARLTQEPHLLEAPAEEHRANASNVRNRS